jgi:hypothetical protein
VPEEHGAADDRRRTEWTEVPAVEACRIIGEKKDLSSSENPAPGPGRHQVSGAVDRLRECGQPATHEDLAAQTADAIAGDGGNRLQEIGGSGEISSARREGGDRLWQPEHDKIADTERCLGDPVQSNGNAR